jgi:ADP-heptose:LPS heptosyltransferase
LKLGDLLCTVPALRALRTALPESEIALIGLPWARAFVDRYSAYLDNFREFPGWPGLPEQPLCWERTFAFLTAIQAEQFDLVVQLHGSGQQTNPLAALLGSTRTAGCYLPGGYRPDPELFLPYPNEGLEVRRLLKLMDFLGLPIQGEHLEFPVYDSDHQTLAALLGTQLGSLEHYVCIHPGASVAERRWPVERFAAVAQSIAARGLRVVLTGTALEANLTQHIAQIVGPACLDLSGRTDLGALAALLSEARLLICNDTGVSHLAAALSTPSVVLSTGDNPARWAPADEQRHRVLCRDGAILPAEVVEQADELLGETPLRGATGDTRRLAVASTL